MTIKHSNNLVPGNRYIPISGKTLADFFNASPKTFTIWTTFFLWWPNVRITCFHIYMHWKTGLGYLLRNYVNWHRPVDRWRHLFYICTSKYNNVIIRCFLITGEWKNDKNDIHMNEYFRIRINWNVILIYQIGRCGPVDMWPLAYFWSRPDVHLAMKLLLMDTMNIFLAHRVSHWLTRDFCISRVVPVTFKCSQNVKMWKYRMQELFFIHSSC